MTSLLPRLPNLAPQWLAESDAAHAVVSERLDGLEPSVTGVVRRVMWRRLLEAHAGVTPIEDNAELTINSVVNNPMLYQEGWGVDCVKHSLTYTGGQSRGCVRTHAPLRRLGFTGFSPYTRPSVVAIAGSIPFAELCDGSIETLY